MKTWLLIAILLAMFLAGCAKPAETAMSPPMTAVKPDTSMPELVDPMPMAVIPPMVPTPEPIPAALADRNFINPGKVTVSGFYPGATAETYIEVHNGGDKATTFSINYQKPDSLKDGYVYFADAGKYVDIEFAEVRLQPKELKQVKVSVNLPKDVVPPSHWEFWVVFKDTGQTGMVQVELASRWLINMKES